MNSVADAPIETPPEAPPPANGAGAPPAVQQAAAELAATLPDDVTRNLARFEQMRKLGHKIALQQVVVTEAETEVSEATTVRQQAMDARNKAQTCLDELLNDLAALADGKFIDKLPFADASSSGDAQAPKPDPDAWKSVPLADVWSEFGGNTKLLTLLADGKIKRGPGQGEVAGIKTLGQLAAFTKDDRKLTDIGGLGESKATAITDVTDKYWAKHPPGTVAATETPKEDPARAGLTWEPGESEFSWQSRSNVLGQVENESSIPFYYRIERDREGFVIDVSDDLLMPFDFPESFPNVEAAKGWCETREAELVSQLPQKHLGATTVVNIESLGLPTGYAEAACFANLLPWLSRGDRVKIDRTITLGGMEFLVTGAPSGHDADVYAFRRIQLDSENVAVLEEGDANPYAGKKIVRGDAKDWVISGSSETMLVRDPGTKVDLDRRVIVETSPAEGKPARKGGKKKAAKKVVAKSKKKRK